MFKLKENRKIGHYLSELIDKNFKSKRQFCKAYIKIDGGRADVEEIQKMANRISQIIKGTKSIQTYDLPIFNKLLGVSCEEILSAGEYFVPVINRLTNYSIAFTKDKNIWEQYINRDDKLILNSDEYGKTVIDYALEFKNFEFLKYLMENKYISFVDADENKYCSTFSAGTSIERRPLEKTDYLQCKLTENDKLRMKMISLAIDHNDFQMLTELRAREIPSLYMVNYLSFNAPDCDNYFDMSMLNHVANASEQILDYFSEEFEVKGYHKTKNTFLFPYMSYLMDLLIDKKSPHLEKILRKAIEHNQKTYNRLKELISYAINNSYKRYVKNENELNDYLKDYVEKNKNETITYIMGDFRYYKNGNIVSFRNPVIIDGIITNIVSANKKSSDNRINSLIEELNTLFDNIRYFKP